MATPKHEAVYDFLKSLLAGIVGDDGVTYWYTPEAVIDAADFDASCLNTSKDTVYCLSPMDSEVEPLTFNTTTVAHEIKLSLAHRFAPVDENPFDPPDPTRRQVQSRLIADATKKLNSDWDLSGAALRVGVGMEIRRAEETYYQGWAVAHLMLRAEYNYADSEP